MKDVPVHGYRAMERAKLGDSPRYKLLQLKSLRLRSLTYLGILCIKCFEKNDEMALLHDRHTIAAFLLQARPVPTI